MSVVEEGAEFFFQPVIEELGIASSLKEKRYLERFADACGDEGGTWPPMAGDQAVNALASGRLGIAARDNRLKTTLVDIDKLFAPAHVAFTKAQIGLPLRKVPLPVACRFFYRTISSSAVHARCSAGRHQNAAPALSASYRWALPPGGAKPASPGAAALWDQDAYSSTHQVHRPSDKRWPGSPETSRPLLPYFHHPLQTPSRVCANPMNISCLQHITLPYKSLNIYGLGYK